MFDTIMELFPDGNPTTTDEVYNTISEDDFPRLFSLFTKYREAKYKQALVYVGEVSKDYEMIGGERKGGHYYFTFWLNDNKTKKFEVRV